jgi:hypothetical protein
MHTIKLRISDSVFEKLMWFLGKFNKSEVEIITEDEDLRLIKNYLDGELKEMDNGKARYISIDEFESNLNEEMKKYENRD